MQSWREFSPALRRGALTGAATGFLFGFDTAVISGSTALLREQFHLSSRALGWTVSAALWGTVFGALASGPLGQRWGGRAVLRLLAAFYAISALGCALSPTWSWLIAARILGGVAVGGSSVIGPVYVAELAPAQWRGRLVGMFQVNVVVGVLMAYSSNYILERCDLGLRLWRWELGAAFLPALALLLLLAGVPESPRWLSTQRRYDEARSVLFALGSRDPAGQVYAMAASNAEDARGERPRLFTRAHRRPLLIAVALGAFNQLSGINAILYYLNDIFGAAGFNRLTSSSLAVVVGAMNLIATGIAVAAIDRVGRRRLLVVGSIGMAVTLGGVASLFVRHSGKQGLAALLGIYMIFFAVSQGAVIWVYLSEIFPNAVRARGQSVGTTTHWVMNAIIANIFPTLAVYGMAMPFTFFGSMMVLQLIFVLTCVPETRGKTLEEIATLMSGQQMRQSSSRHA
ncbi:MAG: sugar porter family MFS transporter [Acidobacteria bacterium]|nr:sugar porter family MFS transporter [Acidobacteriota bacterium]